MPEATDTMKLPQAGEQVLDVGNERRSTRPLSRSINENYF